MKTKNILAAALVGALAFTNAHSQEPIPTSAAQVPGPAPGTTMTKEYVQAVGRMAYIWGWPLVNMGNRSVAFCKLPEPGLIGGVLPAGFNGAMILTDYVSPDQRAVACPNQDVAYGFGVCQLDQEPMVLQVPDFGDRFWVYALYDQRTDDSPRSAKPTAPSPASTWWSARIGRAKRPPASPP